ncbi:O-methyltransferase [Salinimicrobium sediminilitoris]|uniref:O-methyltransferase n=1 Tax=Salinimicrobium sediminilitoris TaxID=2876715 RepID=UPI001E28605B|nr:class I SAM-dependent methyltransferase [Salinimicrobium sediminilitoris]
MHSPFVYNLVTKCFYDRKKHLSYLILKQYRKSLLKDERTIRIKDFGAGSRVLKSDEREVSKMAKIAGISPKRARLLNRLVRYLEVDTALELGTSLGMGTAAMAAGNNIKITTLEGCPETGKVAEEKFQEFGLRNVELKVGEFEEKLVVSGQWSVVRPNSQLTTDNRLAYGADFQSMTNRNSKFQIPNSQKKQPTTDSPQPTTPISILNTKYSLLFIDGNHQKEATLAYFEKLLATVHNDSVMIFDDIHWSRGMEEAWEEIKAHPQVRVSIDTFQWGMVFFRREQEKEHFVIRV